MEKTKKHLCIIGCGTYGSYLLRRLIEEKGDEIEITVLEIGDEDIKTEEEIGLLSESENSKASKTGRYFGLGGTSARWGGQLLFFDERDNISNDPDWSHIVRINNKYKQKVIGKILGGNLPKKFFEGDDKNVKTGIWLKYFKRNLFGHLKKEQLDNVQVIKNYRVVDFIHSEKNIEKVVCKNKKGEIKEISADQFYLTSGAIESCRLLLDFSKKNSVLKNTTLGKNYGDHISMQLFKVHGQPILDGTDFTFTFHDGSFITKRIVVHSKNGLTGYLHFIFNENVEVFNSLKKFLFGQQRSTFVFFQILKGIPFLFKTGIKFLFQKKLHLDKEWKLVLDMEQPVPNKNSVHILPKKDKYESSAVKINWEVSPEDRTEMEEVMEKAQAILDRSGLNYEPLFGKISQDKMEDIYHPVGFVRMGSDEDAPVDLNGQVKGTDNLFHFSTALFPSAKSINPTAAGFCLIEEHIDSNKI